MTASAEWSDSDRLLVSCYSFDMRIQRMSWAVKRHTGITGPEMHPKPGGVLSVSLQTGEWEVLTRKATPFGMTTAGSTLYICDVFRAAVREFSVSATGIVYRRTIRHRLFNDLHDILYDRNNDRFLVVSSGVDAILEFDRNFTLTNVWDVAKIVTGESVIESMPPTFDFSATESIATNTQKTHVNAVAVEPNGLRCSLFHQGEVVLLKEGGGYDTLAKDLQHPHASVWFNNHYYVADSERQRVAIYDSKWNYQAELTYDGWVQNVRVLKLGGADFLAVAEVDTATIMILDSSHRVVKSLRFPNDFRLVDVMVDPVEGNEL